MPLDARVRRFLGFLAAANPPDARSATVEDRRAGLSSLMKFGGPPPALPQVEDRSVPGAQGELRVRIYSPSGADMAPGLIYFHGGGLVAGSLDTHDVIARTLAHSGAARVISVDYRLAPEHRFPAALEDAAAAVRHIGAHAAEFGIDPERLGICGDSAGATLAASTSQSLASGGPKLKLQLLLCPILDYSRITHSKRDLSSGYLVDQATLDHDLMYYLPAGVDASNPRVSPLLTADLAGLPPTRIHTAEFDPLRDEGRSYYERLIAAGNDVSYTCHPGMIHLFYGLGGVIPYARAAFDRIGAEIRTALA